MPNRLTAADLARRLRRMAGSLAILLLASCSAKPPATPAPVAFSGPTMGTWYHVKCGVLPASVAEQELATAIDETLQRVNRCMSTYQPDSELSRFNQQESDDWFPVSPETAQVVAAAIHLSEQTEGAFDVTVGPLVNLWNFGPDPQPERLPSAEEIAAAKARVGYRNLAARLDPPALRKQRLDLYVDLSAIAKGFGVDEVARLLDQRGIDSYMVEVGGEVRTRGVKPDGDGWRIGIERPVESARVVERVIELVDRSLATSGDYRIYFERDGRRYSHEIDPQTGEPVENTLASASVLAGDCMTADGVATALMVMGVKRGLAYAEAKGVDVLLIERDGDCLVEHMTAGFRAILDDP